MHVARAELTLSFVTITPTYFAPLSSIGSMTDMSDIRHVKRRTAQEKLFNCTLMRFFLHLTGVSYIDDTAMMSRIGFRLKIFRTIFAHVFLVT